MVKKKTTGFGWIHSFDEYKNIFALNDVDLGKKLLIFPAGISNFNAQAHQNNPHIVSADEYYQLSPMEIDKYVDERLERLKQKCQDLGDKIDQDKIITQANITANEFKTDFAQGKLDGRYQAMQLPQLPIPNESFDIALCPRCPLQHRDNNHLKAMEIINELCRIAFDVRIFISVANDDSLQQNLGPLLLHLQNTDAFITINDIDIHTPQTHTAMLRIVQRSCNINNNTVSPE